MLSLRVLVIYENGCHSIFKFYCGSSVARWCYLSQSPQRDFCQPLHGSEEQNLKLSGVNNLFTRNTFKRFSDKKNKETNEPKKQTNKQIKNTSKQTNREAAISADVFWATKRTDHSFGVSSRHLGLGLTEES